MCRALENEARYDTPDRHGETRRQRNERFGAESPRVRPPQNGRYLWEWYADAAATRRMDEGMPQLLTPQEWQAWAEINGEIVRKEEFAVLMQMDRAFVYAMRKELNEQRQREADKQRSR